MELTRDLTIADMEGGAIIERLEIGLKEVLEDCSDVNKIPDDVREINCKIKIKPDAERMVLMIGTEVNTKLGKRHPVMAKGFLDESTGTAVEATAKQGSLFDKQDQGSGEISDKMTVIGGRNQ